MKEKTKIIFALSCFSVLTVGAVVTGTSNSSTFGLVFANSSNVWKHYKQALPGTVDGTANGVREYWVECGGRTYQFAAPTGVTIEEGTDYDVSEFETDDPRWIIPLTGNYKSIFIDERGWSNYTETPELTSLSADGWWYRGELPALGQSKKMLWIQTNAEKSSLMPQFYVDTLRVTNWINSWANTDYSLNKYFHSKDGHTYDGTAEDCVEGYYVLLNDISVLNNVNNGTYPFKDVPPIYLGGVHATFDGRGHKVTSLTGDSTGIFNGGYFGLLNGATIKNTTFVSGMPQSFSAVLASQANDCLFENLQFEFVKVVAGDNGYGRLVSKLSANNIYKNVSIKVASGQSLNNVFGGHTPANNSFENVIYQADAEPNKWASPDAGGTGTAKDRGITFVSNGSTVMKSRKDIDMEQESVSLTFEGLTDAVTGMTLVTNDGTTYDLGTDPSNITVPVDLKAEALENQHGDAHIVVTTSKETNAYPVTLVTKFIKNAQDMAAVRGYNLEKKLYGFYAMANDVVVDYSESGIGQTTGTGWSTSANGFYGVFDGRGYVVKGNVFTAKYGIFGTIQGSAIIRNVNVYNDNYTGYNVVFGYGCMGASVLSEIRFVNCDVNIKNVSGKADVRTGILFCGGLNTIAFHNMVVTIRGSFDVNNKVSLFPENYLTSTTRLNRFIWNTPHADTLNLIADQTGMNPGLTINYLD